MEYGTIAGLGDHVPRLILGSVAAASAPFEEVAALYDAYVARGGRALETAHDYGGGRTEQIIGDWLERRGQRGRVLVFTKGAHHESGTLRRRVNPEEIARDLDESLARLRVDAVDLFMLHRDDPDLPVGPIVEALNEHVRAGRVRALGASNWTDQRIEEANRYAAERGLLGFAASSPNLALAVAKEPVWHEALSVAGDATALEWYRRTQTPLISWSSQARGFFAGPFPPDDPRAPEINRVYDTAENWERLRRAKELAARKGCTPTQVALAWVLRQPFPTFALIGPRSIAELEDCLGALEVELSPDEAAWLNLER